MFALWRKEPGRRCDYEPKDGMQKTVHFLPKKEANSVLFNEFLDEKECCLMRFINYARVFRDVHIY